MSTKDNLINLGRVRSSRARDALIADLHRTRVPVAHCDQLGRPAVGQPADPQMNTELLKLLRACVSAMEMQLGREQDELDINQPAARKIWDDALEPAKAAIGYLDERANDQVIDLDADAWTALKDAIEQSPRIQEMYQAGGTFTDACASVRSWLTEIEPDQSPSP
jgi:hypothetical protein